MMTQIFFSLALTLLPLTTAHVAGRQAAGSLTTSSIPSEILTAGAESITDSAVLATATALSSITGTAAEATKTSSSTPTPTKSLAPCHNSGGDLAPFCEPTNGTSITVGETYYVTWDPSFFTSDTEVVIQVSYADDSVTSGSSIYSTDQVESSQGWAPVDVKSAWLQGNSSTNIAFHMAQVSTTDSSGSSATILDGPTAEITNGDSTTNDTNAPLDTSTSSKSYAHLGTVVGLTIGFSFLVLLLVSGLFLFYRRRQRRNRTYGVAKSRNQRLDQPLPKHPSWHGQPSMEDRRQGMVMA